MDFLKKVFITILKKRQGCSLCSKPSKLTKEMFIEKSNKIHGKTYDYSETEYIHGKEKIMIKCNKHGIFEILPINHLKGQKCPTCSGRNKVTNELFTIFTIFTIFFPNLFQFLFQFLFQQLPLIF